MTIYRVKKKKEPTVTSLKTTDNCQVSMHNDQGGFLFIYLKNIANSNYFQRLETNSFMQQRFRQRLILTGLGFSFELHFFRCFAKLSSNTVLSEKN